MSRGLRSSVQNAMKGALASVSNGARVATSLHALPSRISTWKPFFSFSAASATLVLSWQL